MTAITSTGSGNWPTCLSAVPTVNDDVTISAGHLVNVPSGTSGAYKTLVVNHTGGQTGLTIALGGLLRCQDASAAVYSQTATQSIPTANSTVPGILVLGTLVTSQGITAGSGSFSAPIETRGGGRIEGQGHLAAHATLTMIQLGAVAQTSSPNGRLNVTNASLANPAVFSRLYFSNNGLSGGGTPQVDGAQFLNCGSSTQDVFTWSLFNANFTVKLVNVVFDGCGRIVNNTNSMAGNHVCRYENVTIRNSVTNASTASAIVTGPGSAISTGTRTMWNVRSDRTININAPSFDLTNVVADVSDAGALNAKPFNLGTSAGFTRFEKVITRFKSSFNGGGSWTLPYGTTVDRLLVLSQNSVNTHPIAIGASASAASATTTITRAILQNVTQDVSGDGFLVTTNPTNLQTIILRNCMSLPCASDHTKQSISLITPKSDPTNTRWTAEHCTVFTSGSIESGLIGLGETWSTATNPAPSTGVVIFPSVRSNLVYGLGSGIARGVIVRYGSSGATGYTQNNFDPDAVGWNCKFNLSNGTDGVGYIGDNGNGTPSIMNPAGGTAGANVNFGRNDVVADPQFVSGTTFPDLGTYYATVKGTTGTVLGDFEAAFAEMMRKNDVTGYDSRFEPDTIIDWIISQYRPQNAALDAAHDAGSPTTMAGATMGAAPRLVVATPAPAIALTPASVRFTERQGNPSPPAQTVAITNGGTGGTGALTGITATVDSAFSGQLTASLDQTVDPAVLTLTPNYSGLTMGQPFNVNVAIGSTAPGATNSPLNLPVAFEVEAPVLTAPTLNPTGTPTADTVPLSWAAAGGGAAPVTYDVQYGEGATPATWTTVTSVTATNAVVGGLAAATLYAFRLFTHDNSGQQILSNVVTATTTAAPRPPGVFGVDRRRRALLC
jgi:hypothetical protein